MAKTIQFNTKRLYTASGQRIIATLHDDNVVTFHDVDRMVSGEYAFSCRMWYIRSKGTDASLRSQSVSKHCPRTSRCVLRGQRQRQSQPQRALMSPYSKIVVGLTTAGTLGFFLTAKASDVDYLSSAKIGDGTPSGVFFYT